MLKILGKKNHFLDSTKTADMGIKYIQEGTESLSAKDKPIKVHKIKESLYVCKNYAVLSVCEESSKVPAWIQEKGPILTLLTGTATYKASTDLKLVGPKAQA